MWTQLYDLLPSRWRINLLRSRVRRKLIYLKPCLFRVIVAIIIECELSSKIEGVARTFTRFASTFHADLIFFLDSFANIPDLYNHPWSCSRDRELLHSISLCSFKIKFSRGNFLPQDTSWENSGEEPSISVCINYKTFILEGFFWKFRNILFALVKKK